MAATLDGKFIASLDSEFRKRVLIALVGAAIGNVGSPIGGGTGADKRTAFARDVIADPQAHLEQAMLMVVQDGTDQVSSDAQITARVGGLWDAFSGVRGGE